MILKKISEKLTKFRDIAVVCHGSQRNPRIITVKSPYVTAYRYHAISSLQRDANSRTEDYLLLLAGIHAHEAWTCSKNRGSRQGMRSRELSARRHSSSRGDTRLRRIYITSCGFHIEVDPETQKVPAWSDLRLKLMMRSQALIALAMQLHRSDGELHHHSELPTQDSGSFDSDLDGFGAAALQ
jgi:hypothetical protein